MLTSKRHSVSLADMAGLWQRRGGYIFGQEMCEKFKNFFSFIRFLFFN